MVERDVLAAHCRAMIKEYALGPKERVLQFSQYSFDASLEQILPTLAAGGRLVMRGPSSLVAPATAGGSEEPAGHGHEPAAGLLAPGGAGVGAARRMSWRTCGCGW